MHARTFSGTNQEQILARVRQTIASSLGCLPDVALDRPEVMLVEPESAKILRKSILQVIQDLSLATSSANNERWVVIKHADCMNQEAANALLKLLEEPPDRTQFILTTTSPAKLLPTIRSRTAIIAVKDVETQVAQSSLMLAKTVGARFALIAQDHDLHSLKQTYEELLQALRDAHVYEELSWLTAYDAYTQNVPNYRLLLEAWAARKVQV